MPEVYRPCPVEPPQEVEFTEKLYPPRDRKEVMR
jgi:hypothetical protein